MVYSDLNTTSDLTILSRPSTGNGSYFHEKLRFLTVCPYLLTTSPSTDLSIVVFDSTRVLGDEESSDGSFDSTPERPEKSAESITQFSTCTEEDGEEVVVDETIDDDETGDNGRDGCIGSFFNSRVDSTNDAVDSNSNKEQYKKDCTDFFSAKVNGNNVIPTLSSSVWVLTIVSGLSKEPIGRWI